MTVYCKSGNPATASNSYKGVNLVHFQKITNQALDYAYNAVLPTAHASFSRGEIIHYFGCDQIPFTFFSRILGKNVVLSLDGLEWERSSYPWSFRAYLRSFAELAMVFPRMTTVDSRRSETWYLKRTGKRPRFISYGASTSTQIDHDVLSRYGLSHKKYILFVGRLIHEKGAHTLVEAFRNVKTDLRLVIIGDAKNPGPYVERLKKSDDKRLLFLGFVHGSDYEAIRNSALIYVHPSLFDGTSISLLAALASGKCVISSDIYDNEEVAGDAAVYFKNNDDNDLAEQLQRLLDSPAKIAELENRAMNHARDMYDWDKITDAYERLYTVMTTT